MVELCGAETHSKVSVLLDPATKSMLQFGLIGVALAGALLGGLQARPGTVFPFNGTVSVQLIDSSPYGASSTGCHDDCSVTSLNITIDSVRVHREGVPSLTGGWFTVSQGSRTLDIVKLANIGQLIGQADLPPGVINLVRVSVSSANAALSSTGSKVPVMIPSGKIDVVLNPGAEVRSGMITTLVLDFPSSIVCEGNSRCHVKPVLLSRVVGPR